MVNGKPEPQAPVTNYHFLSQDGRWKLNLTGFIALSTLSYPGWEEFARMLDKPLATFIQLYKPAYFRRRGSAVSQYRFPERAGAGGYAVA
ncbi:MAG: TIGR04255 family protein [Oscillospiraceae bacterium]